MRFLSNKEKKSLKANLPKNFSFDKKDEICQRGKVILKNKKPFLINLDGRFIPHLKAKEDFEDFGEVFVDRGAIPFIIKGADLMRPGIQKFEGNILEGDIILIKDDEHGLLLALGFALFNREKMEKKTKGKVIKIFNYIGDEYC